MSTPTTKPERPAMAGTEWHQALDQRPSERSPSGDTDVLVVGAGPAGLTLALDLARRGVRLRIIDKAREPARQSRALAVHPRTVEIFEQLGVSGEAHVQGHILRGARFMAGPRELAHIRFDGLDSPFPYTLALEQSRTERILAERLSKFGVAIERGRSLVALAQDQGGVQAVVEADGGSRERLHARYLVGCDGARSAVRGLLGLSYEGVTADERYLFADCHVDFARLWPDDELVAFLGERSRLLFGTFRGGLRRVIVTLSKGDPRMPAADGSPLLADIQGVLDEDHPAAGARLRDPVWLSAFKVNTRMVDRFRVGRCFVAGDAAHIHSPSGGQGMNTGIQDAFNLGWKLALALGEPPRREALLDSYEAERKPVAAQVLRATRLVDYLITQRHNELFRRTRNTLLPVLTSFDFVRERVPRALSGAEVSYRSSPIVEGRIQSLVDWLGARGDEPHASLHDVLGFPDEPAPGDPAPDADDVAPGGDPARRFHELLAGDTRHQALFFPGGEPSAARLAKLGEDAARVSREAGEFVRPWLVVAPDLAGSPFALADHSGNLARRYGAADTECLVLIRPDMHVGFRSEPAEVAALFEHLWAWTPQGRLEDWLAPALA